MMLARWTICLVAVLGVFGCAQVPQQSVELSTLIGRDLEELQRSHRKAIDLLYDRELERVDRFMEQTIVPTYVNTVMDSLGPRLSQDLAKALARDAAQGDKDRLYGEMQKVVLGITTHVQQQRATLVEPIEQARKARLQELDMAYAQIQKANAALTAHLTSISKVNAVQDELLAQTGLQDFRQQVGDSALSADQQLKDILDQAKDTEEAVTKLKALFDQATK